MLRAFVRSLFAELRRRARQHWNLRLEQCGAVTFVQRFGSAMNLNLHFHTLALDGIYPYTPAREEGPAFFPLCGATMRLPAAIEDPAVARRILACLGLSARAPPLDLAPADLPDANSAGAPAEDHRDFDQTPVYDDP